MNPHPRDDFKFKHSLQAVIVFILGLNAIALAYLLFSSYDISSRAYSRISNLLSLADNKLSLVSSTSTPTASPSTVVSPSSTPPDPIDAPVLTMIPVESISSTGACFSIEGLHSTQHIQAAQALLATGPLRTASWTVKTPYPAVYSGGIVSEHLSDSHKTVQLLAQYGIEPLSISAKFVGISQGDSEESALHLAQTILSSDIKLTPKVIQVSPAGTQSSLIARVRSDSESQFASSLTTRIPGTSLLPAPCPPDQAAHMTQDKSTGGS